MKVVQVTSSSKGGAGIAAMRLHLALREAGVSSAYVSKDVTIDFSGTKIKDDFFTYRKPSILTRIARKVKKLFGSTQQQEFESELSKLNQGMSYEILSMPFSKYHLTSHALIEEATVINLHMVTGILDYNTFFLTNKKPIVWTLHDMNPFLGMFHYNGDRQQNPSAKKLEEVLKELKRKAIAQCEQGALVSPSQWLIDEAKASEVFSHFSEKRVIPNGIDLTAFHPKAPSLREELGIASNEKVLLFVAGSLDIARKGFDLMLEALAEINFPLTVLTLGKGAIESPNHAVKIIPLGFKTKSKEIAACYATADAYILPSREDNLPNTMLESLAVGTPVISYAIGGMKAHIRNGFNGILAKDISGVSLREAIEEFFNPFADFNAKEIRTYAEENFSLATQAANYSNLYRTIVKPSSQE